MTGPDRYRKEPNRRTHAVRTTHEIMGNRPSRKPHADGAHRACAGRTPAAAEASRQCLTSPHEATGQRASTPRRASAGARNLDYGDGARPRDPGRAA
ncbi:hypothetical protein SCALM49S_10080 [Streptomyces californicus]